MDLLKHTPRFTAQEAHDILREHYNLIGCRLTTLPSERDQNFLVTSANGDRFVLKIANALEDPAFLDAQQQVMTHLAAATDVCPRVATTRSGEAMVPVSSHLARLVTYLPGVPLAEVHDPSPELLRDLGRVLGVMDRALVDFDHPACERDFHWDLAHGTRLIHEQLDRITDLEQHETISRLANQFERDVAPLLPSLRRSVIHGDANDYNVIVDRECVVGIIDFGDMVHSCTVANLAVAAAYVLLDAPDPLARAAHVVAGYHAVFPLTDHEIESLFGLMYLRLCFSACMAALQMQQRPDDPYLAVSQAPVRRTLPRLLKIHPRFALMVFRQACGLDPSPTSTAIVRWLRENTSAMRPILDIDPRTAKSIVLDLSAGSPLIDGDDRDNDEAVLTPRIRESMRQAGVSLAIGRYNEARLLYTEPMFATGPGLLDERRTIHLGLDLFAEAGTAVHAPLDGVVHAIANNQAKQDYGPVIILRHRTPEGQAFCTLYGHLSLESIALHQVGQQIDAGQRIGTLGEPSINGCWTPHLHFQIITDLLDLDCDFSGVAVPSQREVWLSLSPDPNLIVGIPEDRFPPPEPSLPQTLTTRRERLGRNLSIAYRRPLKIVRGWMQYLFDHEGRRCLDAYNNVPHVGHCHPRVVEAAQRQMGVLSTNTRYLSDVVNEFAARLTATLPVPLSVCYFLSSASEANELAIRLARAHTRRRDMIVLDAAYHGNTNTLIDISPYKHAGPGGKGKPSWVHVAPIPDVYRGPYKTNAGEQYAQHVRDIINQHPESIAAFIAESCPSVGGQIMLPTGYLDAVYRHVRSAGGVCIADEVQTGYGRIGTHFWAFEQQGVIPDIVVMGKPMGNGHPLAAVVTTPAIAESFDNGMEFFSTFGGNTVSCAVGLAVLDVMEEEGLQSHALRVGEHLLRGLRPFVERHRLVGDVRGSGLFLGVELVRDRTTLEPAGEEASLIANRMRECGILLGTDGPYHNVVKIRPPMPFSESDADLLMETMDRVMKDL